MSALEMSLSPLHPVEHVEFDIDAVLFDMDGTLVDSIAAVEAAWTSVAVELGQSPEAVIAATHGKRAIDNLRELKPSFRRLTNDEMEPHVEAFEKRILWEADEYGEKVRSRRSSVASSRAMSRSVSENNSRMQSRSQSTTLFAGLALSKSRLASFTQGSSHGGNSPYTDSGYAPSDTNLNFVNQKLAHLTEIERLEMRDGLGDLVSPFDDDDEEDIDFSDLGPDKSVRILPSVARLIEQLPEGRYAVATSGAKTYCHGALARAGITRPAVTITADDPRLKRGKPFPDPFILAAEDLGYPVERCLVFEDSPSGIVAGVSSGATTIAVCTSHPVEKISASGAHYIVPSLDCVHASRNPDGSIHITIDAHPPGHGNHGCPGLHPAVPPV